MAATLCLHVGGKEISREELALVEPPVSESRMWRPIKHLRVLEMAEQTLTSGGFDIEKTHLGVSENRHRFWATLDLRARLVEGVGLSVGLRSSTDQSLSVGFCAGSRTFVCDNSAFSADLVVHRKSTINGATRYQEAISLAVQGLHQFQQAEAMRFQVMQTNVLPPYQADAWLIELFHRGILTARTLPMAIRQWREPEFEWGHNGTVYHLYQALTTTVQSTVRTNPKRHARVTMDIMALLFPRADAPFDQICDMSFIPDDALPDEPIDVNFTQE